MEPVNKPVNNFAIFDELTKILQVQMNMLPTVTSVPEVSAQCEVISELIKKIIVISLFEQKCPPIYLNKLEVDFGRIQSTTDIERDKISTILKKSSIWNIFSRDIDGAKVATLIKLSDELENAKEQICKRKELILMGEFYDKSFDKESIISDTSFFRLLDSEWDNFYKTTPKDECLSRAQHCEFKNFTLTCAALLNKHTTVKIYPFRGEAQEVNVIEFVRYSLDKEIYKDYIMKLLQDPSVILNSGITAEKYLKIFKNVLLFISKEIKIFDKEIESSSSDKEIENSSYNVVDIPSDIEQEDSQAENETCSLQ